MGVNPVDRHNIYYFVASGALLGLMFGLRASWNLLKFSAPHRYADETEFELTAKTKNDEPPVILLEDPEGGILRMSRLDTSLKDWNRLAQEFVRSKYAYNQNIYEQVFGRKNEIGRTKYRLFSAQFYAANFIKQQGNSYEFTDFGKKKIAQLSKGDWRVIYEIPEEAVAV